METINRGFSFKLDPTPEQEISFRKFAGVCRLIYNVALNQREDFWRQFRRETGKSINYPAQARELTDLRREFDWISEVYVSCQQQALRDLDKAFGNFFAGRASYPTPRRKGINESFRFPGREVEVRQLNRRWFAVRLPKIGWVRFLSTQPILGTIKNATISLTPLGWHVSFSCEFLHETLIRLKPSLGADRGVATTVAFSDGTSASIPLEEIRLLDRRARKAQQIVAGRMRGSKRHAKAKKCVAQIRAKAARVRKDFNHKTTTFLAENFNVVAIEDLNIGNMTASAAGTLAEPGKNVAQKSGLNRSILEQGWGQFEVFLKYKLAENGGQLIKVDPRNTSRKCNECGSIDARNRESQAIFRCIKCGHEAHADVNAARNILLAAMGIILAGTRPAPQKRESRLAA